MCNIDVHAFHLMRRSNKAFYGKWQLPATVGLERHQEQYQWLQHFIRRKYQYEVKVETFTLACGHRQWNKNTTEGSTTHIKSKKAAI